MRRLKVKSIFLIAFVTMTVVLTSVTLYTMALNMEVYTALRRLNVTVREFEVNIVNATFATLETRLTIDNPSEVGFQAVLMRQILYLNNDYFWGQFTLQPSYEYPTPVPPHSSAEVVIEMRAPGSKIEILTNSGRKEWASHVTLWLEIPLYGRFGPLYFYRKH